MKRVGAMRKKFDRVYQFKITLKEVKPTVWRRIQVPESYTFWHLHVAIQDAMGWMDSHLHAFRVVNPKTGEQDEIGIPDDDGDLEFIPGWEVDIADYFSTENRTAGYEYDFGDDWEHSVVLEKILPSEKGFQYPVCLDGERSCPPEDCGGPPGYERFLEAIKNPRHKEHKSMLEWVGGGFDPEDFKRDKVRFDDPVKRWKYAFGGGGLL